MERTTLEHLPISVSEKVVVVTRAYYLLIEEFTPSISELAAWFVQLPVNQKTEMAALDPALWFTLPAFRRYFLEKRGHSMEAYMAAHLAPAELSYWLAEEEGKQ